MIISNVYLAIYLCIGTILEKNVNIALKINSLIHIQENANHVLL
jgi:hypothetical protein